MSDDYLISISPLLSGVHLCCSTVTREGFPLAAALHGAQGQGFMAETFVRPPVSLSLHLPCPLKIASIWWDTRVNGQESGVHEVLVGAPVSPARCSPQCSLHRQGSLASLTSVGKGKAQDGSIAFINRKVDTVHSKEGYRLRLEHDSLVDLLQIKILTTERISIPCLKNLRLYVRLSGRLKHKKIEGNLVKEILHRSDSIATSSNVGSFYGHCGGQEEDEEVKIISCNLQQKLPDKSEISGEPDCEIPSEFLDSITHELMQLPMSLPSGHQVDRSTLDKCADHWARWGGMSRDPFTGKLFTEKVKPVFNVALKSRIDHYLTREGTQSKISDSGRTLGSAQMIQQFLKTKNTIGPKRMHSDSLEESSSGKKLRQEPTPPHVEEVKDSSLDSALKTALSNVEHITSFYNI